jgi:voltage-gated potassium channel
VRSPGDPTLARGAVTTVTTVGYGDLYPTTVSGRIIGMVLMFVGIGFLSLLTASIASRFVKEERGEEHLEVLEALRRIEPDVAELKGRIQQPRGDRPPAVVFDQSAPMSPHSFSPRGG